MNCRWNRKTDKEGLKNLINVMFPIYCFYLVDRGTNLTSVEYRRNFIPILKSGILDEETLYFVKNNIEQIELDLNIPKEESIINEIFKNGDNK